MTEYEAYETDGLPAPELTAATVERVVDGDTLIVSTGAAGGGAAERLRVRLIGVNAPESVAPEPERNSADGQLASSWMHAHVQPGSQVWLQADLLDTDEYGRALRYVWMERPEDPWSTREFREKCLNAQVVAAGQAAAQSYPPNTTWDLLLQALEEG